MTTRRRPPAGPVSLRRPPRDGRVGCDLVSSRVGRLGSSGWAMILGPVPGAGRCLAVGVSAGVSSSLVAAAAASGSAGAFASGAGVSVVAAV